MPILDEISSLLGANHDLCLTRRSFLVGSFFAALALGMAGTVAEAGKINPSETHVTLPDEIKWVAWPGLATP
jgi:hypothetical protein